MATRITKSFLYFWKSQFGFLQCVCSWLQITYIISFSCTCCLIQKVSFHRSHWTVCSEFWPCELSLELPRVSCQPQHCHFQCSGQFSSESPLNGVKRNWPGREEGSKGAQKAQGSAHTCPSEHLLSSSTASCSCGVLQRCHLADLKGVATAVASLSLAAWGLGLAASCEGPPGTSLPGGALEGLAQEGS